MSSRQTTRCVWRTRSRSNTRKFSVPADSRAELVQALCVAGGGVVKFWQVVYSLQNHLQHVADLLQHATWLHASQHLKEGERQEMKNEPLKGVASNKACALVSRLGALSGLLPGIWPVFSFVCVRHKCPECDLWTNNFIPPSVKKRSFPQQIHTLQERVKLSEEKVRWDRRCSVWRLWELHHLNSEMNITL